MDRRPLSWQHLLRQVVGALLLSAFKVDEPPKLGMPLPYQAHGLSRHCHALAGPLCIQGSSFEDLTAAVEWQVLCTEYLIYCTIYQHASPSPGRLLYLASQRTTLLLRGPFLPGTRLGRCTYKHLLLPKNPLAILHNKSKSAVSSVSAVTGVRARHNFLLLPSLCWGLLVLGGLAAGAWPKSFVDRDTTVRPLSLSFRAHLPSY